MKEAEIQIKEFIECHFQVKSIKIEDFPLFPYGKLLTDENGGTTVIFYDIVTGQIKTEI